MGTVAAIDVGSHTARLLIARLEPPGAWRAVLRTRAYIRLADDFLESEEGWIKPAAMARALDALEGFARALKEFGVRETRAVATGVVRDALNAGDLLDRVAGKTGIRVRVISGEEEALLTGRGVLRGLGAGRDPKVIFDLGGGSTEFVLCRNTRMDVRSIPLGAMLLMRRFLDSDPPREGEIRRLRDHVDGVLRDHLPPDAAGPPGTGVVGTGGTVTTLAAVIHGIPAGQIAPEGMNGLGLRREEIEGVLGRLRGLDPEQRVSLLGLDRGRADVILAGTLAVLRILHHLGSTGMTVSLSDLLEGLLVDDGGTNEGNGSSGRLHF